jgi:hypothetical protein
VREKEKQKVGKDNGVLIVVRAALRPLVSWRSAFTRVYFHTDDLQTSRFNFLSRRRFEAVRKKIV